MIIHIDIARIGSAIAQMLMLFTLEFIGIGFLKLLFSKGKTVIDSVFAVIEILLIFAVIFVWFY